MMRLRKRTNRFPAAALIAVGLWLATGAPCPAADGPARRRVPEFNEMLGTILLKGADMAPGEGWFHPSQSRYGWSWLAARDKDKDQAISLGEFGGPAPLFDRLDRDHDGAITADDLDWSERSTYLRSRGPARGRFFMMDGDSNGRITLKEWDAAFRRIARGKDHLIPDDLADAFYTPPPRPRKGSPPPPNDDPSRWLLVKALFKGELGSATEGPNVGDEAPDFSLRTFDGKRRVSLSEVKGRKPVVLIFGSFT
jgi:hypothetical protein